MKLEFTRWEKETQIIPSYSDDSRMHSEISDRNQSVCSVAFYQEVNEMTRQDEHVSESLQR